MCGDTPQRPDENKSNSRARARLTVPVAVVWLAYAAVSVLIAGYALHLDKERYGPLWSLPLQQLFYRQLIYLVVIQSVVSALSGLHLPWHKLERTGEVVVPAA